MPRDKNMAPFTDRLRPSKRVAIFMLPWSFRHNTSSPVKKTNRIASHRLVGLRDVHISLGSAGSSDCGAHQVRGAAALGDSMLLAC
jgi:hypothetical protein